MEHLSEAQVAVLRQRLLAERDRLRKTVDDESRRRPPRTTAATWKTAPRVSMAAPNARLRQRHHSQRLEEVKAALVRIDEGLYGVCEETGEDIPFARLQLEPTTRYTVAALELLEAERARERVRGDDDGDAAY